MAEEKYSYRNEINSIAQQEKLEKAKKNWKRNLTGTVVCCVLFLATFGCILQGITLPNNLMYPLFAVSFCGLFYFIRAMKTVPKGQLVGSGIKALICWLIGLVYVWAHRGNYDTMDGVLLMVLFGLPLLDLPKVIKAYKNLKSEQV